MGHIKLHELGDEGNHSSSTLDKLNGLISDDNIASESNLNYISGEVSQVQSRIDSVSAKVATLSSGIWNSSYSTVMNNSGNWESGAADLTYISGKVDNNTSNINIVSGNLDNNTIKTDSVYSTTESNSSTWSLTANYDSEIGSLSSAIDNNTTTINNISNTSGEWDSCYSTVEANSASEWQNIFGTEYHYDSSESESSTTSNSWQNKITTIVNSLPTGTYRVGWYYETRTKTTTSSGLIRVLINGTDVSDISVENQDSTNYAAYSGFANTSDTNLSITIDYKSESSGKTTLIRKTRIEIWRLT